MAEPNIGECLMQVSTSPDSTTRLVEYLMILDDNKILLKQVVYRTVR